MGSVTLHPEESTFLNGASRSSLPTTFMPIHGAHSIAFGTPTVF
jgi:hypothetical protein